MGFSGEDRDAGFDMPYNSKAKQRAHDAAYRKKWHAKRKDYNKKRMQAFYAAWLVIIKEKGRDKCCRCGYNKYFGAIDFHHLNPKAKRFVPARMIRQKITAERLEELDKTISLCSNCHRELHREVAQWI